MVADKARIPSRSNFTVPIGGGLIVLVILMLIGWSILNGRTEAHRTAEVANSNFSQALATHFVNAISQIDLGLLAIADEVARQQRSGDLDEREIAAVIARQDERHPGSLGYRIFGPEGRLRFGNKNVSDQNADISERDDFKYLRDHQDSSLFVSPPTMSATAHQWVILLARRLNNADGSFSGAVYALIPIRELKKVFAALDVGAHGVILLAHSSYKIAAWVPLLKGMEDPVGTDGTSEKLRAIINSGVQEAQYDAVSPVDGMDRAVHVRKIEGQPYYVLVALAAEDYLSEWRRETVHILIFGAFMVGLVIAGTIALHFRARERERVERTVERERLRWQTILRTASDGIHILDSDGTLIEANDAFLNMLGYDYSAVGKIHVTDWDVGTPWSEIKLRIAHFIAHQGQEIFEARHRQQNGSIIDVEINARGIEIDGKNYIYAASRDITERKLSLIELQRIKAIVEYSEDAIIGKTLDGTITSWNHGAEKVFGYTAEEAIGNPLTILIPPERVNEEKEILESISLGKNVDHFQTIRRCKDGRLIDISATISPVLDKEGKIVGISKIARDITEHKRMEQALLDSEMRFRQAMEACNDGVWDWQIESGWAYFSPAYFRMLGYDPDELPMTSQTWVNLLHPEDCPRALAAAQECIENRCEQIDVEFRMKAKDGSWRWILGRGRALQRDPDGRAVRIVGTNVDITERKAVEQKLQEMARTYPLTGLANRRTCVEALGSEFLRCKRFGSDAAVLMIDIDHFKRINDTHGHEAGDHALVALTETMKTVVRATDLLSRFGGEEFVVLLVGTDLLGAMDMAERIRDAVAQMVVPFPSGDLGFTVSIGVAAFLDEDRDASDAIHRADQAMYRSKRLGRNKVVASASLENEDYIGADKDFGQGI